MIKIGLTSYTPRTFSVSYIVLFPHAGNHDDSMVTVTVFGTAILVDPFVVLVSIENTSNHPDSVLLYFHTPRTWLSILNCHSNFYPSFQYTHSSQQPSWPTKLIVNECTVCRDGKSSHCRQVAVVGECPLAGARLYLEV